MIARSENKSKAVLILNLDCQGAVKGSGTAQINLEIKPWTHMSFRSCRVIYTDTDAYTANPVLFLWLSFVSSAQLNTNMSKTLIPIPTSNGLDTTTFPRISFTLDKKVPTHIDWAVYDINLNRITDVETVIACFDYEQS